MKVSSLSLQSARNSRQVIACVDRAPDARNIVNTAASLALALDLPLTLYHVIEPAEGPGQRPDPLEWNLRRQQARSYLAQLHRSLPRDLKSVSVEVAEGGRVQSISERGAASGSLLVMGVNGEGENLLFRERTAQRVVAAGVGPVLLVPKGRALSELSLRRILVPLDGSHFSEAALAEATKLARKTGAELLLAHVVPEAGLMAYGPPESADLELRVRLDQRNQVIASDFLEQTSRRMAQQGLKVRSICLTGETRSTLQQAIVEADPSLVVLSARGQGGRHCLDLPIGSTASYLLEHIVGPTMLVPAKAPRTGHPILPAPELRISAFTHAA